jgi:hypothetical protein
MFDDLQQYTAGKTFVSAADMNTLRDAVRFLRNLFGANVLDDPDGLAFRKPTRYRDVQLIRVANEQDGQGVWDAWTLLPTTNRSHLDPSNNVSLTELFDDNEKVYFYDARDDAPTYNSPSGTDRVHSFAGEFVPALKMPFTSGTGTNERRVFVATTGGTGGSGSESRLMYVVEAVPFRTGKYYLQPAIYPFAGDTTGDDFNILNGGGDSSWTYNATTNGASVGLNAYEINGAGTPLDLTSMTAEERVFICHKLPQQELRTDISAFVDLYIFEPLQFKNDCDV